MPEPQATATDAEAIAAHLRAHGVTRLPPRGAARYASLAADIARRAAHRDPYGRLRMMLQCTPANGRRAAYLAADVARQEHPPTQAEPRKYLRKGQPYTGWIADDGVIWVRQEPIAPTTGD